MPLILTKALPLFVYPLGAAVLIGATVFLLEFSNRRRLRRVLLALVLSGLWISATPLFADWLSWQVASAALPDACEMREQSDAVILLGGTPSSRIVHALKLHRAGKAPRILITARASEAQRVANQLVELGAPRSALVLETKSRNTRDNAVGVAALFAKRGWEKGLLVTSSTHMRRALAAFRKVGLAVSAAPTEFPGPASLRNILDVLPDAEALAKTTFAIRELVGLYVYRYRGWV